MKCCEWCKVVDNESTIADVVDVFDRMADDEETADCAKGLIEWIKTQKPGTPVDLCMSDVEHSKGLFVLNFYTLEHIKYCPMCGRQL